MPILTKKKWNDLTSSERFESQRREWALTSITAYLNVEAVAKAIDHFNEKTNTEHHALKWAYDNLQHTYHDEIGYAQRLLTENAENAEFNAMIATCEVANGKELTGNLEEWIMDTDNKYEYEHYLL